MVETTCKIWFVASHYDVPADAIDVLDHSERTRSARLLREADRAAFVTTRAALRYLLSMIIDVPPADIEFTTHPGGKLSLASAHEHCDVDFSVSHTEGLSAIGISHCGAIGIDIERRRPVPDRIGIVSRLLGSRVARQLEKWPTERQNEIFLQLWTATEAYAKVTGLGLAAISEQISVTISGDGTPSLDAPPAGHDAVAWRLLSLAPSTEYIGSTVMKDSSATPLRAPMSETTTLAALSSARVW
jgi:4'-phosphopantetheinyl transferase